MTETIVRPRVVLNALVRCADCGTPVEHGRHTDSNTTDCGRARFVQNTGTTDAGRFEFEVQS